MSFDRYYIDHGSSNSFLTEFDPFFSFSLAQHYMLEKLTKNEDKNMNNLHLNGFWVLWADLEYWDTEQVYWAASCPPFICTWKPIVQQMTTDRSHHHLHIPSIQIVVKFINLVVFAESFTLQEKTSEISKKKDWEWSVKIYCWEK